MNFEVFKTESEINARISALREQGITNIIQSFNGSDWVLKWQEQSK